MSNALRSTNSLAEYICCAPCPDDYYYVCSLGQGHLGNHKAYGDHQIHDAASLRYEWYGDYLIEEEGGLPDGCT